jgi:hypothetical protein
MQGKDSEESVMEKPDVCSKETENGDAKQQGGLKKRIKDGRRSAATPPGSKQDYATISRNVSSPKGECGDTHHIDASVSDARRSNGNSTEDQIPKVDLVD